MVKKNINKKKGKKVRVKTIIKKMANTNGLDTAAVAYARLLSDPCAAPLAHPIYPGSDSGFLFRAESFFTWGSSTTMTSGAFHWSPGYVNSSSTELLVFETTGGTANGTFGASSQGPGKSFLGTNAKGVRCVAACLKVTFPGSESTRSGRVHYGHTQAGMCDLGNITTADAVAQALQHYSRTPAETFEIVWKPNIADTEFNDPSEAASALLRDRKSAVTVAWAGLPSAVGLTFHMTAIYEWTPAVGLGVGHNALGKSRSRNSLDDVIDSLIARGFSFVRGMGYAAGNGMAAGLLSTVSQGFGLMPAARMTRSLGTIRG